VIRRAGFSLIEMLIVVVVIGLMMLMALPRLNDAFAQNSLGSARAKVISLFSVARATASGSSRTTVLHLSGNRIYVTASPRLVAAGASTIDTVTEAVSIATEYGVTVTPTIDSILLDQSGLGRNGATIVLSKSGRADTIVIKQYGGVTSK
jgi:prepilin-type N-terminal cleavage/methylation domain-containing protein